MLWLSFIMQNTGGRGRKGYREGMVHWSSVAINATTIFTGMPDGPSLKMNPLEDLTKLVN